MYSTLWKPSTLKYQAVPAEELSTTAKVSLVNGKEWLLDFLTAQTPRKSREGEHISSVSLYYCVTPRLINRKEHFLLIKAQTKRADLKDFLLKVHSANKSLTLYLEPDEWKHLKTMLNKTWADWLIIEDLVSGFVRQI